MDKKASRRLSSKKAVMPLTRREMLQTIAIGAIATPIASMPIGKSNA